MSMCWSCCALVPHTEVAQLLQDERVCLDLKWHWRGWSLRVWCQRTVASTARCARGDTEAWQTARCCRCCFRWRWRRNWRWRAKKVGDHDFMWGIAEAKCVLVMVVCVSACLSVPRHIPTLLHRPGCYLGNGSMYPLVVHYWADLQSVHGFRFLLWQHGAKREMSTSACTHSVLDVVVSDTNDDDDSSITTGSEALHTI